MIWHRGYLISKAFMGYNHQHPAFDPENPTDWRHGTGATVDDCKADIDALLEEDAQWTEAVRIVRDVANYVILGGGPVSDADQKMMIEAMSRDSEPLDEVEP